MQVQLKVKYGKNMEQKNGGKVRSTIENKLEV